VKVAAKRTRETVAFVIQHYPPFIGGAEQQVRILAEAFAREGDGCEVVTSRFSGDLPRDAVESGVRVRRLPTLRTRTYRANLPTARRGIPHLALNFLVAFLYFLLNGHRFQVVYGYCTSPFVLGGLLGARLRKCRTILRPSTSGPHGEIASLRKHALAGLLMDIVLKADKIVAQTRELAREIVDAGVPESEVAVIPNAVSFPCPTGPFRETQKEARLALEMEDRPTVLFVGRFVPEKGIRMLVEAWGEFSLSRDAVLLVVGDGPEKERLSRWKARPGGAGTIDIRGWQAETETYYRAADFLIFPSCRETYGNVIAEAMACGLPVITTPVGMARQAVRSGVNGLVVECGDAAGLAAAMGRLFDSEPLRRRLGSQGREDVMRLCAPEVIVRAHRDLLESLEG
jgi:glycosyltransferase involved in cell wall biosynthesis